MLSTAARNQLLDTLTGLYCSVHTAYSSTGANEVSGGSPAYARKAATFAAASAAARASSNSPIFDIPASTTVRYIGLWTAVTGGTFLGMTANGGAEKEFGMDTTANTLRSPAHGWSADQKVVFLGTSAPGGLTVGTVYYVRSPATDTFQVSASAGGGAITLSTAPSTDCVVSAIVEETFSAQGFLTVSSQSIALTA